MRWHFTSNVGAVIFDANDISVQRFTPENQEFSFRHLFIV
jgi:hypothetical protein